MSVSTLLPVSAPPSALPVGPLVASSAQSRVQSSTPSAAQSDSASTSTSANSIASAGSSSLQAVTTDLVALLKALASGNVSESKASLARLQADIRTQQSASVSATTASEQPPFNVVLNRVAESLAAASTGKALQELATYLIQGGQESGNLVDEHA